MTSSTIDEYRKKSSFEPESLKITVEGVEHVRIKKEIYNKLSSDELFRRDFRVLSREEQREITHRRWKKLLEWGLYSDPYVDLDKFRALSEVLEIYDQGLAARLFLHASVFGGAVTSMGTERHAELIRKIHNNEIVGCFCLTEVSHGSNTAEVQTTATFDNGHFVFDSPTPGSIKCWAGNLSYSSTHAVVFARLRVGGEDLGPHGFVLQIRDMNTFDTLPGISIGDMGAKPIGWNGVENGWMQFKGHRAPLWCLLNKGCDVTDDGRYVSSFKSASERQSVSLGTLSVGRIGIIAKGAMACGFAATIALRWSVARRQFGPQKGAEHEVPVFEYPLQQFRLVPYLAASIVIRIFHNSFMEHFTEYMMRVIQGEKSQEISDYSKEVHALSSAAKPTCTWLGVESLTEARKACGGHGYLHLSRLNELRDSYDPSQTFEGENFVLLQQTSNVLISKAKNGGSNMPMRTMDFVGEQPKKFISFTADVIEDVLSAYRYLLHHLLQSTVSDFDRLTSQGQSHFDVRNNIQVHRAALLSIAYSEHTIIDWTRKFIEDVSDRSEREVLRKVLSVFALFVLERHLATLYIGEYTSSGEFGAQIRLKLRDAIASLKDEVISLVDVVAPPDIGLHSALGVSDGKAYEAILNEFRKYEGEKPEWTQDLAQFLRQNEEAFKSKI